MRAAGLSGLLLVLASVLAPTAARAQGARALPSEAFGFRLGWTLAQSRDACERTGRAWYDVETNAGECVLGDHARVSLEARAGRVWELRFSEPASVDAVTELLVALERRYGEHGDASTGDAACLEAARRGAWDCVLRGDALFVGRWALVGGVVTLEMGRVPGGAPRLSLSAARDETPVPDREGSLLPWVVPSSVDARRSEADGWLFGAPAVLLVSGVLAAIAGLGAWNPSTTGRAEAALGLGIASGTIAIGAIVMFVVGLVLRGDADAESAARRLALGRRLELTSGPGELGFGVALGL